MTQVRQYNTDDAKSVQWILERMATASSDEVYADMRHLLGVMLAEDHTIPCEIISE